jgi:hypothetical protein
MLKRDVQATELARFEDPRSYVAKDGREVLFGYDWKARKNQLWVRCGGICEYKFPSGRTMIRCRAEAADPHHLVKRSELRDDRLENLMGICRTHHDLLDERKPRWTKRKA